MNISIEKELAKNGSQTLKINGFYIHSKFNPEGECEKYIDNKYIPETVNIIFGYGLGYIVDTLLKKDNLGKIYIIDPILSEKDFRHEKNVEIKFINSSDEQEIIEKLKGIEVHEKVNILESPNYSKIFPVEYKSFLKAVRFITSSIRINENTIRFFAETWQHNYIMNLKNAIQDYSLINLRDKYDYPVVIASGGPSLTKQLELVKKYRDKMILIAAGSTINSLIKSNIEPDYVISIDGGISNYNHFKDLKLDKTKLIYSLENHYKITDSFIRKGYYFAADSKINSILKHIEKITNSIIVGVPGGISVATYALSIAYFISNGPIALIGQDLAITRNLTHAENNNHSEEISKEILLSDYILEEGYYSEKVYTNQLFLNMKDVFNSIGKIIKEKRPLFNCTEGGLLIEKIENKPFQDFCKEYLIKNVEIIETPLKKEEDLKNLEVMLKNELVIFDQLLKIINENVKIMEKQKKLNVFSDKVLKKLDKNDKKIYSMFESSPTGIALNRIHLEVLKYFNPKLNETEKEKYERVCKQNEYLYSEMKQLVLGVIDSYKYLIKEIEGNKNGNGNYRSNAKL